MTTHYDPFAIGTDSQGQSIEWAFTEVSNFNALFQGISGGGKTWTIHNFSARAYVRGLTFHVMDIKGDFKYENYEDSGLGHLVRPEDFNVIHFNYVDGSSLNPLQVPRSKQGGGVLMAIESMRLLVKQFAPNTGTKQLGYLSDILREVYLKKGIVHDDIESWGNTPPTLLDVLDQCDLIANTIASKLPIGSVQDLLNLYAGARNKADKILQKAHGTDQSIDSLRAEIKEVCNSLVDKLAETAHNHINYDNVEKGHHARGTMWEHWSRESLYGLRNTIRDMCESRLFTGPQARAQQGKFNVYDLADLSPQHQQIIMRIVAARVFAMGVQETRRLGTYNPAFPSHILIADEGKHIKEISSSALSPFNRIATEGRGYGVGAWLGVQQPDQITTDLLKNIATTVLLKTPEAGYGEVSKMFGVKPSLLKQLVTRQNILFSKGGSFSLVTHFKDT
jgi:hypothetical protein